MKAVVLVIVLVCFVGSNCAARDQSSSKEQSWIGLTKQVYIVGIWQPYLKTVNLCLDFRQNTTPGLFTVWPEDDGKFCCEDRFTQATDSSYSTIASYAHSEKNGRFLFPIPYYDVGIINEKTPYWRSLFFDRISQTDITNVVYCEVNDLKHFYVRRFWREAFAKQGLLYSAVPFIILVELLVLLSVLPQLILSSRSLVARPKSRNINTDPRPSSAAFPRFLGWETTWDLVHLCFLGVNGSLLMEDVGHSDPCGWEANLLYNSAVVYAYLTALSIVTAVLQQSALWSRKITNDRLHHVETMALAKIIITDKDWYVKRYKISKEWQLQRMSAQAAVLFVASLYSTFVTVFSREEFVAWLVGIIIIGEVWSCSVGLAMLSKAVKLGRKCFKHHRLAKERERELALQIAVYPQCTTNSDTTVPAIHTTESATV